MSNAEPAHMEPLDNALWRLPLETPTLPPATRTNTYAVGQQRILLVDPAPSDAAERQKLLAWAQHPPRGGNVVGLVLTHHHWDHVGAASWLAKELQLPILAHPETAKRVEAKVETLLQDGEALPCDGPDWVGVFTPGHAAGHLCFHRKDDGAVLAGDMVAGTGTILVDPVEGSMRLYLASLERLLELQARVLFPSHGPALEPAENRLRFYLAHRRARSQAVLERVQAGDQTPEAMVPHIYAGTPVEAYALAAHSVLAMLIHHQEEGRVQQRENGTWNPA